MFLICSFSCAIREKSTPQLRPHRFIALRAFLFPSPFKGVCFLSPGLGCFVLPRSGRVQKEVKGHHGQSVFDTKTIRATTNCNQSVRKPGVRR
jgi:hypothetical protein